MNVLPYRPQVNGITERLNRKILNMLRTSLVSGDIDWDIWLPIVQCAINNTYHNTLGDIPHCIGYGEDRRLPYELIEQQPTSISYQEEAGNIQGCT